MFNYGHSLGGACPLLSADDAAELCEVIRRKICAKLREAARRPDIIEPRPFHGNIPDIIAAGGVLVEISGENVSFSGLDDLEVLDQLTAWVRQHRDIIFSIKDLHRDPVKWVPDPQAERVDDVAPVFIAVLRLSPKAVSRLLKTLTKS